MAHLSNDHKNCANQHENSHKLYDEAGHPVLNLMESQWKWKCQAMKTDIQLVYLTLPPHKNEKTVKIMIKT